MPPKGASATAMRSDLAVDVHAGEPAPTGDGVEFVDVEFFGGIQFRVGGHRHAPFFVVLRTLSRCDHPPADDWKHGRLRAAVAALQRQATDPRSSRPCCPWVYCERQRCFTQCQQRAGSTRGDPRAKLRRDQHRSIACWIRTNGSRILQMSSDFGGCQQRTCCDRARDQEYPVLVRTSCRRCSLSRNDSRHSGLSGAPPGSPNSRHGRGA
jgi:hypothetical protein